MARASSFERALAKQQEAIVQSIKAINEHSGIIAENTRMLKEFLIKHEAQTREEHKRILSALKEDKEYLYKYIIFPLIVILAALIGIKLALPVG